MGEEFIEDILAQETIVEGEAKVNDASKVDNTDGSVDTNESEPLGSAGALEEKQNSVEELATQLGWNPNYQGEGAVDAATYILRSKDIQESMKTHNKDLKKQLNTLLGSVEALKEHNERVYKADVRRMEAEISALKKQRKEAIEFADVAKVEEIEEQISEIQNDLSGAKKGDAAPPTGTNPIYDEWVTENKWYLENDEMAQYADTVAREYEGAPVERLFNLVTKKVKEVFPEAFEVTPQVKEPIGGKKPIGPKSPVEGGNNSAKGASNFTKADLSPDQLQIMKQFVQGGIMTEQQYINDIAKMQGA